MQTYLSSGVLVPGANDDKAKGECVQRYWNGNSVSVNGERTKVWRSLLPSHAGPVDRGCSVTISHLDQHLSREVTGNVSVTVTPVQGLTSEHCRRDKQHRNRVQTSIQDVAPQRRACWNEYLKCSKYWFCIASVYIWGLVEEGNWFSLFLRDGV